MRFASAITQRRILRGGGIFLAQQFEALPCRAYDRIMFLEEEERFYEEEHAHYEDDLLGSDPYLRGPVPDLREAAVKRRKVEIQKTIAAFTLSFSFR